MTSNQRKDIIEIVGQMRNEVEKLAKRPIALQEAADALDKGLADGSLTPEKAREIITHYEAEYLPVPTYEGEKVCYFEVLVQNVVNNP